MAKTDVRERRDADDPEVQAQVLGSGYPEAQEEARQAVIEEVGEAAYNADPERYWTAQQGPMPDVGRLAALGPQRYVAAQLPNPDIAKAGGHRPQQIPEGLLLSDEEAWGHPKGLEPGEMVRLSLNAEVDRRLLEEADDLGSSRNYLTLTSDGMAAIRKAQEGEGDDGDEGEPAGEPVQPGDEPGGPPQPATPSQADGGPATPRP